MGNEEIIEVNKKYWNEHADLWFGTTALPKYGVRFPTEDDLHLFGSWRYAAAAVIRCFIMRKEEQENYGESIFPRNSLKTPLHYCRKTDTQRTCNAPEWKTH